MTPTQQARWVRRHTPALYTAIETILDELELDADISYPICEEVIIHQFRDIERLYVTHHVLVHPTKHCSYMAFWVRKLKPVSNAYPKCVNSEDEQGVPSLEFELTDVNERVAVFIALQILHLYIELGDIAFPAKYTKDQLLEKFSQTISEYLTSTVESDMSMGNRFSAIIYDMRFRTFGPHHLTHVLTHILREVVNA